VTKLLAIVGASARAAAASAVRAGFQVVAADLFADADLGSIAKATRIEHYPADLAGWLQQLRPQPDAWMYTGALENHPDTVDTMAQVAPRWGNSGSVLRQVRSPFRLTDVLQGAHLRFPETRASSAGLSRDGSWLMKTGRGASGSGVSAFTDERSATDGMVYQKRVAGIPYSAVYVAANGEAVLLGIVRQLVGEPWLGAREFQYCGAIGPSHFSATITDEIGRIGTVLSRRFQLVGVFGVDLAIDANLVWTVEVNPRYTASIEVIERTTGMCSIARHAVACSDRSQITHLTENAFNLCGKAILFAKRDVMIDSQLAAKLLAEAKQTTWPALADIPSAQTLIERGRPVLTVFAESETSEQQLEDNLRSRVAIIERTLYS
jgi:predicted ATP-grasp superfamily ATP-dependent carboligase